MIWTGIVNQTITGSFKINEGVKLNSVNNCNIMDKPFFVLFTQPFRSGRIWHKINF